jgi:hypothetical protein
MIHLFYYGRELLQFVVVFLLLYYLLLWLARRMPLLPRLLTHKQEFTGREDRHESYSSASL